MQFKKQDMKQTFVSPYRYLSLRNRKKPLRLTQEYDQPVFNLRPSVVVSTVSTNPFEFDKTGSRKAWNGWHQHTGQSKPSTFVLRTRRSRNSPIGSACLNSYDAKQQSQFQGTSIMHRRNSWSRKKYDGRLFIASLKCMYLDTIVTWFVCGSG